MRGIETFIILPMTAFHLAIMPRCIGTDQLMPDSVAFQMNLEEGGLALL